MKKDLSPKKQKPTPRDEDGNVIYPKHDFDIRESNRFLNTYTFHEWREDLEHYMDIFLWYGEKELRDQHEDLNRKGILVNELFKFPEKPVTKDFEFHAWMRWCAYEFFKEVFRFHYEHDGGINQWDISRIIIRKKQYLEIERLITDNNLLKVHDLIFFIISKIQKTYVDHIEFYESPEMIRRMNNAPKEVEKLITIIDRVDPDLEEKYNKDRERKPEIKNISFIFPEIEPIKIEDPWLNHTIIRAVKQEYSNRAYKNWRKDLKRYAHSFEEDIEKRKFKFRVAIALHNFFTYLKAFPGKKKGVVSSKELLCIAKILEHGLIKVGNAGITDADRIKNIRNYLKSDRHQLRTFQTHLEIYPDLEKLSKYFDSDFLSCTSMVKSIDVIGEATYISERFEIQHLRCEIAHLFDCVKHRKTQLGWQFSVLDQYVDKKEKHPLLGSFHDLVYGVSNSLKKKKLTELNFKLEGDDHSQILKERIPLILIERAIAEYYRNHEEEFNFDIEETQLTDNVQERRWHTKYSGKYRQQQERFLPQFCKRFYKFLLDEAPPTEMEHSGIEKYSIIIGLFLQRCWVFNQIRDEEHVIQHKVRQWLMDAKESPDSSFPLIPEYG